MSKDENARIDRSEEPVSDRSASSGIRDRQLVERELALLEPVVHGERYFGSDRVAIAADLHETYWEVASTGAIYRRDDVLDSLVVYHQERHDPLGVSDLSAEQIADDVWMCSYLLDIAGRLSRRTTLWRWSGSRWQALFHQGTPTPTSD